MAIENRLLPAIPTRKLWMRRRERRPATICLPAVEPPPTRRYRKRLLDSPTLYKIADAVAEFYGLNTEDLWIHCNWNRIVRARQIAFYLARECPGISFPKIGMFFGGMDHTTVVAGAAKIASLVAADTLLQSDIAAIRSRLVEAGNA